MFETSVFWITNQILKNLDVDLNLIREKNRELLYSFNKSGSLKADQNVEQLILLLSLPSVCPLFSFFCLADNQTPRRLVFNQNLSLRASR